MSAARSAREAVTAYQSELQRLFGCITSAVVITHGSPQRDARIRHLEAPISFVPANGDQVPLLAKPTLDLEAALDCIIVRRTDGRGWLVKLVGYI